MAPAATEPLAEDVQRQLLQAGQLLHALARDPKFRPKVLSLMKEADPNAVIPELDLQVDLDRRVADKVQPFEASTKALRDEVDGLKRQLARADTKTTLGLQEDELVEVETLAKERGITNVDTATEFYRLREQALGVPRGTRDPGAEGYRDKLRKTSPRNQAGLKRLALEESNRVLREIRGGRRAG